MKTSTVYYLLCITPFVAASTQSMEPQKKPRNPNLCIALTTNTHVRTHELDSPAPWSKFEAQGLDALGFLLSRRAGYKRSAEGQLQHEHEKKVCLNQAPCSPCYTNLQRAMIQRMSPQQQAAFLAYMQQKQLIGIMQ